MLLLVMALSTQITVELLQHGLSPLPMVRNLLKVEVLFEALVSVTVYTAARSQVFLVLVSVFSIYIDLHFSMNYIPPRRP